MCIILLFIIFRADSENLWKNKRRHGVGVTKPIFSVPLFSQFFRIMKTKVTYMISLSYLTGVAARSRAVDTTWFKISSLYFY